LHQAANNKKDGLLWPVSLSHRFSLGAAGTLANSQECRAHDVESILLVQPALMSQWKFELRVNKRGESREKIGPNKAELNQEEGEIFGEAAEDSSL